MIVVVLDISSDQSILFLKARLLLAVKHRVVQRLNFQSPVERFHRCIVVTVPFPRKAMIHAHIREQIAKHF